MRAGCRPQTAPRRSPTTQAWEELASDYPEAYPQAEFLSQLAAYRKEWDAACSTTAGAEDRGRRLLAELDKMTRLMLVEANPLLRGQQLLLVKRFTYDSQHYYDDYYHGPRAWGGNLVVVSLADGKTREIVPELRGGIFDRYDLSFDASGSCSLSRPEAMAIACMG